MSYDLDIRRARRWALILGLVNLACASINAYQRNWAVAAAGTIWALCCWLWRRVIDVQQKTRDTGRVIEAGLNAMRREIETGEF